MTTGALAGLTLVVTRPAAQAGPFIALAAAAGANCIALPALLIETLSLSAAKRAGVLSTEWDWAIYTSVNAVTGACEQLPHLRARQVAAIGVATARALARNGVKVAAVPETRADSEGLLLQPAFQLVQGQHILVLKGAGGREVLPAELSRRGAKVQTVELYRRSDAKPAAPVVADLQRALVGQASVSVVVTSVEILEALLRIVPAAATTALRVRRLYVPGPRVAAAAARLGWTGAIVASTSAEDAAMLQAVLATEGAAPDAC